MGAGGEQRRVALGDPGAEQRRGQELVDAVDAVGVQRRARGAFDAVDLDVGEARGDELGVQLLGPVQLGCVEAEPRIVAAGREDLPRDRLRRLVQARMGT